MRFLTFESKGTQRPGLLADDGRIVDLIAALAYAREQGALSSEGSIPGDLLGLIRAGETFLHAAEALAGLAKDGALAGASLDPDACRLLAPIPRPAKNVFCVGRNYAAHVSEGYKARKMKEVLPEHPQFFTKPPTAVSGPDAAIRLDPEVTQKLDYEVELAVVIGRRGRDIPAAEAESHIFGYTIANDVTARDLQRRHDQWFKGKGLDGSCPMGPHIVTPDELPNVGALSIGLTVNGEVRQDGNTRDLIFPIPVIIESLSRGMTLEPGDIISTGTPSGVGYAMDPPQFLKAGDEVTCRIEGIGTLTNWIADKEAA
jgi:2-keto-4-pentenoate hydratase/2-oxohepta-3-ene-1,7-dioic acid hydratase in catechol pathway